MYHHIFGLFLDGRLFTAPVKEPKRILDLGTGTGIWAIEVADEFPDAEVIGTDLSPIQPAYVPPNVRFEIDDMELEWQYGENYFDFIHVRCLAASISDWRLLLKQAYDALKPGGYVQFTDYGGEIWCDDETMDENSSFKLWFKLINEGSEHAKRPLTAWKSIKGHLESLGYEDIEETVYKWPVGMWPRSKKLKEIGKWTLPGVLDSLSGFSMALLTRHLGWKKEEVDVLVAKARQELLSNQMHTYSIGYFIHARKPLGPSSKD
jgi:SAM-dependent methyltransferase